MGPTLLSAQTETFLADVRKACSGFIEVHAKGTGGTIKFQNYDISVDAGNSMDIYYEGALIKKIDKFAATDYVQCVKELASVMKEIQGKK
jgi:hypothetical protein